MARRLLVATAISLITFSLLGPSEAEVPAQCHNLDLWVTGHLPDPYARPELGAGALPMDSRGSAIFRLDGERFFHPVATAQAGLSASALGDWGAAAKAADALEGHSVLEQSARLFPYAFAYEFDDRRLEPPWYSGMAQGQALSLFAKLYEHTGEGRYLRLAAETSAGLRRFEVVIDGHRWANEYPIQPINIVLNGAIWAAWGWWDYWRITGRAFDAICGSLDAIRNALAEDPDAALYYDLRRHFRIPPDNLYHTIHRVQLEVLWDLTHDQAFRLALQALANDSTGQPSLVPTPIESER